MSGELDAVDRRIVNVLQGGLPLSPTPYSEAAGTVGIAEADLLDRLRRLLDDGYLSRVGPLFDAGALGGAVTLAAMAVPPVRLDVVAAQVNAHPEVAHNYERDHRLNLWFVIAVLDAERLAAVAGEIEAETGLCVHLMPKRAEYYLGLRVTA
ncbi:AsnC family transcriptional regulator [Arhodomonas aquaeolei]|uniref:AsnC family transcriptional regulator n=1 Tax=Arhodomonas aquaeolei TaxID=2369 RepID=UPI002168091E|nr:AsnC family transcriptional regulator [Arhodomonas aquaeolei]MCS4503470.1 AsnC family transcriptional regulator [Arhodomonas aquaeolei]